MDQTQQNDLMKLNEYWINTMLFGSEEDIFIMIEFWCNRFKEHCLVLTFYLHNLNESFYKDTPLKKEENLFRDQALTEFNKWAKLCKNFKEKREEKNKSSLSSESKKINILFQKDGDILNLQNHLKNLMNLKREILKWKEEKHKHPGPLSTSLLKHMLSTEAQYVFDLWTGTMTIEKEYEIAIKEAQEHTQFIAQQIEPSDDVAKNKMKQLMTFAENILQFNIERHDFTKSKEILKETYRIIDEILPGERIKLNMPDAFLHHENLETDYFINRIQITEQARNLIEAQRFRSLNEKRN